MNHYETLGVNRDADYDDIKRAYKKKMLELHPDRNKSIGAIAALDRVKKAYACLSNEKAREAYDNNLDNRSKKSSNLDEWANFFNAFKKSTDEEFRRKNKSKKQFFSADYNLHEPFTCRKRHVPHNQKEVVIPAGVTTGTRLEFADIAVVVNIQPHTKFKVDKNHLFATLYIDAIQAMVGIDLKINHPSGSIINTKIPPGTQENQKIRLAGKGIDSSKYGLGDLYIFCHIVIPQLTDADRDSIIHLLNSSSAEI